MENLYLNLGCGPHFIEGWQNLDLIDHPKVRRFDLRQPLPFATGSAAAVFTEHFLEHLSKDEALRFLAECKRVLKPGGAIRISMPDLQHLLRCYSGRSLIKLTGVWEPQSLCDMVNEGMRLWEHKYLWDYLEIVNVLSALGFTNMARAPWRVSHKLPELGGREVRPFSGDLIIEALS